MTSSGCYVHTHTKCKFMIHQWFTIQARCAMYLNRNIYYFRCKYWLFFCISFGICLETRICINCIIVYMFVCLKCCICVLNAINVCIVLYCIRYYDKVHNAPILCIALYCIGLYCIVLYCTVFYYIVLYCIVLYYRVLYCRVLYCTVLYCTVLYCTVLYCTVLYCTVLYCIVLLITVISWSTKDVLTEEWTRKGFYLHLHSMALSTISLSTLLYKFKVEIKIKLNWD